MTVNITHLRPLFWLAGSALVGGVVSTLLLAPVRSFNQSTGSEQEAMISMELPVAMVPERAKTTKAASTQPTARAPTRVRPPQLNRVARETPRPISHQPEPAPKVGSQIATRSSQAAPAETPKPSVLALARGLEITRHRELSSPTSEVTTPVADPAPVELGDFSAVNGATSEHDAWLDTMLARIEAVKSYPAAARQAGLQGTAVVGFYIDRRGKARHIDLVASSGHTSLDRSALEAVRSASPFPRPPPGSPDPLPIEVPIMFRIDREL